MTVCFETKFSKSQNYKISRYNKYAAKKLFLEISSLGFRKSNTRSFIRFLRELKVDNTERILRKYGEVAIRASFYLHIRKNKE